MIEVPGPAAGADEAGVVDTRGKGQKTHKTGE